MGRKIPARKHHGVRDPIKQNALQLFKIKDKINNPPEKRDHQKVSFKLAEFMKLKEKTKNGKVFNIKRSIQNEDKPGKHSKIQNYRPEKQIKAIKQLPRESDEDYLRRLNRITTQSLKEAEYEAKYGVDVIRDEKTGKITIKKRPKDEALELMNKNKKNSKTRVINKVKPIDKVKSMELIKQALKKLKEENKTETIEEYKRDEIKFGEIVHAPPSLTTLPRRAQKVEGVPRPGKKDNLLLKNLLNGNESNGAPVENTQKSVKLKQISNKVDLKGKRKDLPAITRQMLEVEQNKVVEMYRQMKKSKINNRS